MTVKAFFRWLCAELDGYYVQALAYFMNGHADDIKAAMYYMKTVQLVAPEDVTDGVSSITEDDLFGIGQTAGVTPPYITAESLEGSVRMTGSHIVTVNGVQVQMSERGLYLRGLDRFVFVEDTVDDVNSKATETLQSSLVTSGAPVLGYIASSASGVLTDDGYVDTSKVTSSPPSGEPYVQFFGNQYLHLAESFLYQSQINSSVFLLLLKVMQHARYSNASIKTFADLTELIMEDYVRNISVALVDNHFIVSYTVNELSELSGNTQRIYIWKYFVAQKFPQFILSEQST